MRLKKRLGFWCAVAFAVASSSAVGSAAGPRPAEAMVAELRAGETALVGRSYESALDAFRRAAKLDAKDVVAARGAAYALVRLGRGKQAVAALEVVADARPAPIDASFAVAMAAAFTDAGKPMRAVPTLVACLDANPTGPVDEAVLDALGTALSKVPGGAARGDGFNKAVAAYKRHERRLTDGRPGRRRWGVTWDDADVVAGKEADLVRAGKGVGAATADLAAANANMRAANEEARRPFFGFHTPLQKVAHRNQMTRVVDAAQARVNAAVAEASRANAALAGTEEPPFPAAVATDGVRFSIAAWLPS